MHSHSHTHVFTHTIIDRYNQIHSHIHPHTDSKSHTATHIWSQSCTHTQTSTHAASPTHLTGSHTQPQIVMQSQTQPEAHRHRVRHIVTVIDNRDTVTQTHQVTYSLTYSDYDYTDTYGPSRTHKDNTAHSHGHKHACT